MNSDEALRHSLADFYIDFNDDPFVPSKEYGEWREAAAWVADLYEPVLTDGPRSRTRLGKGSDSAINLASYNYLGLAHHPEVVGAAVGAVEALGTGACGSPILSGMTDLHRDFEAALSGFLELEDTMLFNSGFAGALGSMSGFLRRGDVAVLDERAHVSLQDGARLSGARVELFDHNDAESLDEALSRHPDERRVVVVEGVYSMDGDMGDLPSLVPVAEAHGVSIFIDEAHSILTCGESGRGVVEHFGMSDRVALQYGTFSKAFGGIGGFVGGERASLEYLRYFANSYAFSCALPPGVVAGNRAALGVAMREPELRTRLADNAGYFRGALQDLGLSTGESTTHVVPIIIGSDRALLYELCDALRQRGLLIAPVDFPSVPEDSLRFRASISAVHTRAELDEALNLIEDVVVPRVRG